MFKVFDKYSGAKWRVVLLAMMIPLVLASSVSIWQDYQARREAIITQVSLKSGQIDAQLEDFVHTVRGVTGLFALGWVQKHPPFTADPEELALEKSYLERFVANRPHFSKAFITRSDGTVIVGSSPGAEGTRLGTPELYRQAVKSGEFTASDVITPSASEPPFALFVQPLKWTGEVTEGFFVLQSDLGTISSVLDMSVGFPKSAKSGIFDSQGKIIAGTGYEAPHPGMVVGRDISASAIWAQANSRPTSEWFGPGLDQVDRIIFFSYPDSTPWVTTVAYSQAELFDPLWHRLLIFGGALAATLVAVLWVGEALIRNDRRAVAALVKERLTLDAVMNGATDGIMVIDAKHMVNFANVRLSQMLGVSHEALMGQWVGEVKDLIVSGGDDREEISAQLDRATDVCGDVTVDNLVMNKSAGFELEMTSYPLLNPDGEPLGRTLVFHDVTQARAVQRMRSQFLATASHQLRTPMASILVFSELSLTRNAPPPKQREWIELIHSQSTRMTGIINSILNVSQMESGRLDLKSEKFDAREACDTIIQGLKATANGQNLEVRIPPSLANIRADRSRFTQIVENLVDNAIKYSPDGGTVSVVAEAQQDGMVRFCVADAGVGISQEALRDLFIPFSRVRDERTAHVPGTGLGLYIAKYLAELHNGAMWVESQRGAGTTVYFTMPAAGAQNARPEEAVSVEDEVRIPALATGTALLG